MSASLSRFGLSMVLVDCLGDCRSAATRDSCEPWVSRLFGSLISCVAVARILDCALWPCICNCQSSANFLVLLSLSVVLLVLRLCSSLAFQVFKATILGVLRSAHTGRRPIPDIMGPPKGVMDVASVVSRSACRCVIVKPFHWTPLTLARRRT